MVVVLLASDAGRSQRLSSPPPFRETFIGSAPASFRSRAAALSLSNACSRCPRTVCPEDQNQDQNQGYNYNHNSRADHKQLLGRSSFPPGPPLLLLLLLARTLVRTARGELRHAWLVSQGFDPRPPPPPLSRDPLAARSLTPAPTPPDAPPTALPTAPTSRHPAPPPPSRRAAARAARAAAHAAATFGAWRAVLAAVVLLALAAKRRVGSDAAAEVTPSSAAAAAGASRRRERGRETDDCSTTRAGCVAGYEVERGVPSPERV